MKILNKYILLFIATIVSFIGLFYFNHLVPDSSTYLDFAKNFQEQINPYSKISHDVLRTPGYPALIALSQFFSFIDTDIFIVFSQLLLASLLAFLFSALLKEMLRPRKINNLSLGILVLLLLDATFFFCTFSVISDALFTFLVSILVFLFVKDFAKDRPLLRGVCFGLIVSITALVKPVGEFIIAPMCLSWLICNKLTKANTLAILITIMMQVSILGVWKERNLEATGFSGLSTVPYINLLHYRTSSVIAMRDNVPVDQVKQDLVDKFGVNPKDDQDVKAWVNFATTNLWKSPKAVLKQLLRGLVFFFADPGGIYVAQGIGVVPTGSNVLSLFSTTGWAAVLNYLKGINLYTYLLLGWAVIFTFFQWIFCFQGFRLMLLRSKVEVQNGYLSRFLTISIMLTLYFLCTSLGPETTSRFRLPLIPIIIAFCFYYFLNLPISMWRPQNEGE